MKSIKNFHFPYTDFKTVVGQILHPESHGVLKSLRKLVTRNRKYDLRSRKTLELNIIIIHSKYFPNSDWLKAHV